MIPAREIYKMALQKWGDDLQLDMLVEECSELIKAVTKFKRNPDDPKTVTNLAEECADVRIMMAQLEELMRNKGHQDFSRSIIVKRSEKIDRLEKMLLL